MPLSVTSGGSPDVSSCVASQTPEDFTAHLEMHPLKHLLYRFHFQCGVVYISQILHHPNEPRLQQLPTNRYFIIQSVKHSTKHKRSLNANRKCQKQKFKLKDLVIGNGIFTPKCLSLNYIRKNSVVCDGGAPESDDLKSKWG